MEITNTQFITSASKLSECPVENIPEFAFIGRSNVGKSSLINMLVQRKQLAKTSITPGKTTLLNYFLINGTRHIVDMPGYGYAKTSKTEREQRNHRMREYLTQRKQLFTTFILIDGSIPPQSIDLDHIYALKTQNIHFDIIITKTDKSAQKDIHRNFSLLKKHLQDILGTLPNIFHTSSTKKRGRKEILDYIEKHITT